MITAGSARTGSPAPAGAGRQLEPDSFKAELIAEARSGLEQQLTVAVGATAQQARGLVGQVDTVVVLTCPKFQCDGKVSKVRFPRRDRA